MCYSHKSCLLSFECTQFWKCVMIINDLLQELSSQLREVQGEWSSWSEWSSCSRSCDGGVSQQLRHCHTSKCFGEPIRYKICNMQVSKNAPLQILKVEKCKPLCTLFLNWFNYTKSVMFLLHSQVYSKKLTKTVYDLLQNFNWQ